MHVERVRVRERAGGAETRTAVSTPDCEMHGCTVCKIRICLCAAWASLQHTHTHTHTHT